MHCTFHKEQLSDLLFLVLQKARLGSLAWRQVYNFFKKIWNPSKIAYEILELLISLSCDRFAFKSLYDTTMLYSNVTLRK